MPRRTMTVTELWVHEKGNRKKRTNLSQLPDGDFLHLFRTFATGTTASQLLNRKNESYACLETVEPVGRSLTLAVEVGRYGEQGQVTDVSTMTPKGRFGKNDAIAVVTHGVLTLPKDGTSALLFLERSNNQCGVLRILELFKARFLLAYPDLRLETDPVVESEAWLANANLLRVSAFRRSKSDDKSDNHATAQSPSFAGELAHTLVPSAGNKTLPRWIYDRLKNGELSVGELLSFSDEEGESEAEVTLEYNNKRKTFVISKERRPSISYPLSGHNETEWSADRIRSFVFGPDIAPDLYDRIGLDWPMGATVGSWTPEQLNARMVMRGGEQS